MAVTKPGKVVAAAGTAATSKSAGLAKRIEAAMIAATEQAAADGITDPDKIRKRKLTARERVLAEAKADAAEAKAE
jgi:hypothetical protein